MKKTVLICIALVFMAVPAGAAGLDHAKAGEAAHQKGNYQEAIRLYQLAIKSGDLAQPDLAGMYSNLGSAYKAQGKLDQAIMAYNRALELAPDMFIAYSNRGSAWVDKGRLDLAIEDFSQAIQLKPDYPSAYYNRSYAYEKKGRLKEALSDIKRFIKLDPGHPWGPKRQAALEAKIKAAEK
jgi:tetratricopeptide (TPR) repeat protein